MKVELPIGDVLDRWTILEIKRERLRDPAARANVARELAAVEKAWQDAGLPAVDTLAETAPLRAVNRRLWQVEDDLRSLELEHRFDASFVALARSVYQLNDERARLKRAISVSLGSALIEEKQHPKALGDTIDGSLTSRAPESE